MKKIFIGITALFVSMTLFAERVSQEDAALVANNFMTVASTNSSLRKAPAKRMVLKQNTSVAEPQYYIYENANGEGWVIVSANDAVSPILAYSETGHFRTDNMPANIQAWMNKYDKFIQRIEADGVQASEETAAEWNEARKGLRRATPTNIVVDALIKSKWDQGAPYWNLCPYSSSKGRAYTGCVATAMAQVMNYWQWPIKGTGSHSYKPLDVNDPDQYSKTYTKTLSANFGETTYDWVNMIDKYTYIGSDGYDHELSGITDAQKLAVATLMYHCGVATEMMYGSNSEGGSGTYTINYQDWTDPMCAQNAFFTYFGYKRDGLISYSRDGYSYGGQKYYDKWTTSNWVTMLKGELDKKHPIMYDGASNSGGHSFICDGYGTTGTTNYFHFNWGWSGDNDGWYKLDNLAPGSGGAGGGSYDFSEDQCVIIGIEPEGKTTAIETIAVEEAKAGKVIENGQVVIIRNNEKYTVLGQKIQ